MGNLSGGRTMPTRGAERKAPLLHTARSPQFGAEVWREEGF